MSAALAEVKQNSVPARSFCSAKLQEKFVGWDFAARRYSEITPARCPGGRRRPQRQPPLVRRPQADASETAAERKGISSKVPSLKTPP